jgi:peroxiredoxin
MRRAPPPPPSVLGPNWRTLAIAIVVFLVIAISVYAYTTMDKDEGNGNGDNPPDLERAPEFQVTTVDGEPIALDMFAGKVVVLDLMATWCNPCAIQMDELNDLRARYPERQVVILSIGVDTQESDQQLRDFRDDHYADWRFARDTDSIGDNYDAQSIPKLAIIDQEGWLVWQHSGVTSYDDLVEKIDPLLL